MESHGFKVIVAKPYPISYKVTEVAKNLWYSLVLYMTVSCSFTQEFIVKGRQKTILGAFPELTDEDREVFLPEYKMRVEAAYVPDKDGLFNLHFDGFLIFGEKLWRLSLCFFQYKNLIIKDDLLCHFCLYFTFFVHQERRRTLFCISFLFQSLGKILTCDILLLEGTGRYYVYIARGQGPVQSPSPRSPRVKSKKGKGNLASGLSLKSPYFSRLLTMTHISEVKWPLPAPHLTLKCPGLGLSLTLQAAISLSIS